MQLIAPETPQSQLPTDFEPSAPEDTLFYDPAKAARITECLCELLKPSYILLFGTLADGTPHSGTFTYDLLVVVEGKTPYTWYDAKRYLRMMMPKLGHGAPYVNIYVMTQQEVDSNFTPFVYLIRREGLILYQSTSRQFRRPRKSLDFGEAAVVAQKYSETFLSLADRLLLYAEKMPDRPSLRLSAFAMAQATVYYFRTLFYVYHGFEADTFDVELLHSRLRTLSGELSLLFESDARSSLHTISCLKRFLVHARYDPDFYIHPEELRLHLERVQRLGDIVHRLCRQRIVRYEERA